MSRAVFVSDIHISSNRDPKCDLFQRFLTSCIEKRVDDLFLVGDIFDLWIADREYFVDEYSALIEKFRRLHAAGIRIYFFEGNHDLDLRIFWQDRLGVLVYSEAAFFTINGMKVRVEHGDQMDPEDRGYLFLRWFLRTPVMVTLGRWLPNRVVQWIGRRASAKSRIYTSQIKFANNEDDHVREKIRAHARRVYAAAPFDFIVSGHVHVVENSTVESDGHRYGCVNLGTWLKDPVVLDFYENSAVLKSVERFIDEA